MKAEPYLSINPMGKVPAIEHKGKVVTEVAAICCYLADAFPEAGLGPRDADERADYYRWIFFTSGPIEAAFSNKAAGWEPTPERQRMFGYGNYDLAIEHARKGSDRPRIYRRRPFHRRRLCSSAPTSISCCSSTCSSRGRCSSIMRARMTDREAYRRAKEIDGKLIAEIQAAAGQQDRRWSAWTTIASRRSCSTTATPMKAWTAATSWPDGGDRRQRRRRRGLIATIAASPAAAAIVPADDKRLTTPRRQRSGRRLQAPMSPNRASAR